MLKTSFLTFFRSSSNQISPRSNSSPVPLPTIKFSPSSKVKMSGRLPWESDDEYFRRMVHAHKPVSDIAPSPDPQPLLGVAQWQEEFWNKLNQKKEEPSCSTSTSLSPSSSATGTRPKTSRRSSTRVTPPSDPEEELWIKALYEKPYKTPKWMINRAKRQNGYMYDGESKFLSFELGKGKYYITRDNAPVTLDLEMKTAENGKQYIWWGPKE